MVDVEIDTKLSVSENANKYYEAAKKAKKKAEGAKKAVAAAEKNLKELLERKDEHLKKMEDQLAKVEARKNTKKEWFENFRWFYTSKGHLVVGGRDATSNEIVVKKHMDANDIVFHTDMAGSPFFILKLGDDQATQEEIEEVASATTTFSRAFKLGLATNKVFWVNPDQVSKEAQSGEFLAKGSFMIRGKTNYVTNTSMEVAFGVVDGKLQAAPFLSMLNKTDDIVVVIQGDKKTSDTAKKIKARFGIENLDEVVSKLPAGTFTILDDRQVKERVLNLKHKRK